jgi:hypothetical protein
MNTSHLSRRFLRVRFIDFYMVSDRAGSLDDDEPFLPDVEQVFGQKLSHVNGCIN